MDISQIRRIRSGLGLMVALLVLLPVVLVGLLAGPAQAADDPGSGRVVRVGTEGTYPPFTYADPRTSQLTGYDIEVIKAVAKEAGWRLEFVAVPVRRDLPRAGLQADRHDRQPGHDQPRARGALPVLARPTPTPTA